MKHTETTMKEKIEENHHHFEPKAKVLRFQEHSSHKHVNNDQYAFGCFLITLSDDKIKGNCYHFPRKKNKILHIIFF